MLNELTEMVDVEKPRGILKFPNFNAALNLVNDFHEKSPDVMNPPKFEAEKAQHSKHKYKSSKVFQH